MQLSNYCQLHLNAYLEKRQIVLVYTRHQSTYKYPQIHSTLSTMISPTFSILAASLLLLPASDSIPSVIFRSPVYMYYSEFILSLP